MSQRTKTLRAPAAHRLLLAAVWPIAAFFIARLVIRFTPLPDIALYVVCVGVGLLAGFRAFSAHVNLLSDEIIVHNTLATAQVPRADIKRIGETGRIEWHRDTRRAVRLPVEALHDPRWALGTGSARYATNRETAREWLRTARRRAGEQESYTDVLPIVPTPMPPAPTPASSVSSTLMPPPEPPTYDQIMFGRRKYDQSPPPHESTDDEHPDDQTWDDWRRSS